MILLWLLDILVLLHVAQGHQECRPRDYGQGSVVCVCKSDYCDTVEVNMKLPSDEYAIYQTSKRGDRLSKKVEYFNHTKFSPTQNQQVDIVVDQSVKYQKIIGFGGAMTDAAGININQLPVAAQKKLLQSYFSADGVEHTMLRIPIASCDFSTRIYSYDDMDGDFNLAKFNLSKEDVKYKIPYTLQALGLSKRGIKILGSPWSAPGWMKTSGSMVGNGTMRGSAGDKYHKTWANYFVRFLSAYRSHNISFWGLTVQNEPSSGFIYKYSFQTMGYTPEMERDFVVKDLGPALQSSAFKDTKIMIHDDNRLLLPDWADRVFTSPDASDFISGVAVHWYMDKYTPARILSEVHNHHPDKFILGTEACSLTVSLGEWSRAEDYWTSIIEDMNNWANGWVEWNLALNMEGGPNWVKNFVDSSIMVNATGEEFYKQPTFYVLGHFSKFLPPGSVRIRSDITSGYIYGIKVTAFLSTDGSTVVTVANSNSREMDTNIQSKKTGKQIKYLTPPHTIQTFIWWD